PIARGRVDGRVARDPASYLALYSLDADPVQADPVARLIAAADLRALWRGWIPIELESRPPIPWTDASSTLWLARRGDRLVRAGQTIRVPHRLADRIRRRQSLG